ncbi:hypothetical protein HQN89_15925 [Paenibacillus frigoriresistens]|uniref:hypothetical protein n=1 Tax=Paenibacillus alginolyticus TaxID=59839 RepID=UPI0015675E20|nr:hypothetical protein [Paenibacillus frigoriresistens]NRF92496.1 hypothetical protein [Paenibacillus frigoriresistens]
MLGTASSHDTVELLRLVVTDKGKGFGKATIQPVQWFAFHREAALHGREGAECAGETIVRVDGISGRGDNARRMPRRTRV